MLGTQEEMREQYAYHREMLTYYKSLLNTGVCTCGQPLMKGQNKCRDCMHIAQRKYAKTPAGIRAAAKAQHKNKHSKKYVAKLLGLEPEDLTDELYELKLETLRLHRIMEI